MFFWSKIDDFPLYFPFKWCRIEYSLLGTESARLKGNAELEFLHNLVGGYAEWPGGADRPDEDPEPVSRMPAIPLSVRGSAFISVNGRPFVGSVTHWCGRRALFQFCDPTPPRLGGKKGQGLVQPVRSFGLRPTSGKVLKYL